MTARLTATTQRLAARIQSRCAQGEDRETGMVTSEYAMGTLVSAGCVGVVYTVGTSPPILEVVKRIILRAFNLDF
jgi:hypothetical protein